MRSTRWLGWLLVAILLGGTQAVLLSARANDEKPDEAKIQKNLAKLSAQDRKLAEQQKYCAIEDENRLGVMGVPVKIEVKGQPVFLCCKGCKKEAEANPDKTLAKVKELKEKAKKESKQ